MHTALKTPSNILCDEHASEAHTDLITRLYFDGAVCCVLLRAEAHRTPSECFVLVLHILLMRTLLCLRAWHGSQTVCHYFCILVCVEIHNDTQIM